MKNIFIKYVCLLVISLSFLSCNEKSNFNLQKDFYNFSSKLDDGDTLLVNVDLSACMSRDFQKLIFIRKEGKLFLQTNINDDFFGKIKLKEIEYKYDIKDTLNFENLFLKVREDSILTDGHRYFIQAIYKKHILNFTCKNLGDKLSKGNYYGTIMYKLYPKDSIFQPIKFIEKRN